MKLSLLLLLFTFYFTNSYKILVCNPLAVRSLNMLGQGIVRHLLNDGHEVTYITVFPLENPQIKNYRQIDISTNVRIFDNDKHFGLANALENENMHKSDVRQVQLMNLEHAVRTFQNENVIRLLEDPNEHFDAVIVDLMEIEVYAGLAILYNCPMIWTYSMGAHWQVMKLLGDPGNPAYDPDYLGSNMPPLTFVQRVEELWTRIYWNYVKRSYTYPVERRLYEQVIGPLVAKRGLQLPDYDDVVLNASMIFANEHDAIKYRPSTPENFKYIGGYHIDDDVKPLPKDLEDFMNNSPHGVIYFSMGTFCKSKDMPLKMIRELLDVFGELKQTVLWKFEADLKDIPKNVRVIKWAPQHSILAHPNCKFFITHGGLLSAIESIYFGVATIGIPVMFDQFTNVNKAVINGYAIRVDLSHNLARDLKVAINTMLKDDSYTKTVKKLSAIFHDCQVKPGAEFTHWVRHVIRTQGALHLRSSALYTPLYQMLYLDLLGLVLGICLGVYLALRKLLNKISCSNIKKKEE